MKRALLVVLLLALLLVATCASPATPALRNDTPLGRCYSRCDALWLGFDWCDDACRVVAGVP